ncbi:MAG TPA: hypothetical protein VJA27_02405 [Patescibacteria group bacterium]|nr:hypothetical protein [Patescibacteria group bacterium]
MRISQLVGGLALLLLIGGGCVAKPETTVEGLSPTRDENTQVQIVNSAYRLENEIVKGAKGTVTSFKYRLVFPNGKSNYVSSTVEQKLRANDQVVASFDLPVDPNDTSRIFISTYQSLNEGGTKVLNRVYSFNVTTNALTEIFTTETRGTVLRTVARAGTNIIILEDGIDNSPGPCGSIWSSYPDQFVSLDMRDVAAGLKKFVVPEEKIQADREEEEWCMKLLGL